MLTQVSSHKKELTCDCNLQFLLTSLIVLDDVTAGSVANNLGQNPS